MVVSIAPYLVTAASYCRNKDCCGCIVPCPGCCWDDCCTSACCDGLDGEGEGEPCDGVTCPAKCEGKTRLWCPQGAGNECCEGGNCVYSQENCPYGCVGGNCLDPDNSQALCVQFEFTWLGNMCCGDDANEYTKTSWDGSEIGCCRQESQCFVSSQGSSDYNNNPLTWFTTDQGPRCIDNNQYILDHLCEQGKWTTRTRNVALQLLKEAADENPDDYVVFCDYYSNTLNYYDYLIDEQELVKAKDWLMANSCSYGNEEFSCMNKFCVLADSSGNFRAFGSSINPSFPLNQLYTLLGYDGDCNNALDSNNQFDRCSGSGELWYNNNTESFVYGRGAQGAIGLTQVSWLSASINWLKNRFDALIGFVFPTPPISDEFIEEAHRYDKMYVLRKNTRSILGKQEATYIESTKTDILAIEYTGFTTNICPSINQIKADSCEESSGIYYVKAQRMNNSQNEVFDNWIQITAKLRVNP